MLWVGIIVGAIGLASSGTARSCTVGVHGLRRLVGLGIGLNLATAFTLPLTSADVLMYAAYGRIQRQGLDPIRSPRRRSSGNPSIRCSWTERPRQDTPSVYGPIASASQWLANVLGGESMHDVVFWLQIMSVLPFIIVGLVMIRLARDDAALQTRAALFVLLNPLLIWSVEMPERTTRRSRWCSPSSACCSCAAARSSPASSSPAGAVKVSLVFYGVAMVRGYRRDWRKVVALCVGAVIPLALLYGLFAPQALFAASRNTGYISAGSWAP